MPDLIQIINALANAQLPNILVVAGILFIFLSFVEVIYIYVPLASKPRLRTIGSILLIVGILLYIPTFVPPTLPPEIKITSPKNGEKVSISTIVNGTIYGELPEGQYMWVFVNPQETPYLWWPQGARIEPKKGQWNMPVWVGNTIPDTDIVIAVVLVDKEDDQYLWDYGRAGDQTKNYPGIPLPASAKMIDRVTVTKT